MEIKHVKEKERNMKEESKNRFAFLAHRVENWNWLLNFKIAGDLHKNPSHSWRWVILSPLYYFMSLVYMIGKKGYDQVDKFKFNGSLFGETWLLRNMGWHFFVNPYRTTLKKRIIDAVLELQDRGVEYIGLGALTKAEWLTAGGKMIVDELGDRLSSWIIHGDTLTAAVVVKQFFRQRRKLGSSSPVFITGATSKIGSAASLALAHKKIPVKMFTESKTRFLAIKKEAGKFGEYLIHATCLEEGKDCDIWITGKAIPAGKKLYSSIPRNAAVINFSVPNPISERDKKRRPDLNFIEGGVLEYDPKRTDLYFTMRLRPGLTYACHAGTMVHAKMGWKRHEVGPVDISQLKETWDQAVSLGFGLPDAEMQKEQKPVKTFLFDRMRHAIASIFM